MKIPIEKKRLFKILDDIAYGSYLGRKPYKEPWSWSYAFVYNDDEAIQVLSDLGFVDLKSGDRVLKYLHEENRDLEPHEQPGFIEVHLKNEFLTQVGLALFREEVE